MLRALLIASLVVGCSGCATIWRALTGQEDPNTREARMKGSAALNCSPPNVSVQEKEVIKSFPWSVQGCARAAVCRQDRDDRFECFLLPLPWWFFDEEAQVAVDRLSLETNCPVPGIDREGEANVVHRTESAYRLKACGKSYVCTSAMGRTDCKPALIDSQPAQTPQPAAAPSD